MKRNWFWLVLVVLAWCTSTEMARSQEFMTADGLTPMPMAPQKKLATCDFSHLQIQSVGQPNWKQEWMEL